MSNLILCFSEIAKILICVPVRQGAFSSEDLKCYPSVAVSSLWFFAFEMRKRKAYRKQTGSNVSVLLNKVSTLEHERFKQIICKYISLSDKLDYERRGLYTYQVVSRFQ